MRYATDVSHLALETRALLFPLLAASLAFSAACGNDDGGPVPDAGPRDSGIGGNMDGGDDGCAEATFSSIHTTILGTARCATLGCHAGQNPQGELDLSGGASSAFEELIAQGTFRADSAAQYPNRVTPGDPSASFLWIKISEDNAPGGRMPLVPPFLEPCNLTAIETWIQNGAMNN